MPQSRPQPLHSLRMQFLTGIAALLVILAGLSVFASFRMQNALVDVRNATTEFADDMETIASLQNAVFRYAAGSTVESKDNAGRLADVERLFSVALERLAADEHARSSELLRQAADEWRLVTQPDALAAASVHLASVGAALDSVRGIEANSVSADLIGAQRDIAVPALGLRVMLVFAVAASAIGIGALYRTVLSPLRQLRDGAQRFANGDLDYRMQPEHADEFGQVSRVFNAMAERLSDQVRTLTNQAARDPLTRLYNRRELERRLDEELSRARRYHRSFALLMLDIDHFKAVNDTHGHLAGDDVLVEIARRLEAEVRIIDFVARFGGEEFVVVLSEVDGPAAAIVAERIRTAMHEPFTGANPSQPVLTTVSIGIAQAPVHGVNARALLAAADSALYQAKEAGRDTIRLFSPLRSGVAGDHS